MNRNNNTITRLRYLLYAGLVLGVLSCSTTSRIADDELLYTGVKKLNIKCENESLQLDEAVAEDIATAINVKPNNSLYSPYLRHPFPVGLWVYNHWSDSAKGLKGWLYTRLVEEPVLISAVKPKHRVEMINTVLQDNGYFDSRASY